MSNKKVFQELYAKKINKEQNYKAILEKREKCNQKKWGNLILVPLCLALFSCGLLIFNNKESLEEKNKEDEPKSNVVLNKILII